MKRAHAAMGALGGALSFAVIAVFWNDPDDADGRAATSAAASLSAPQTRDAELRQAATQPPLEERHRAAAPSATVESDATAARVYNDNELQLDPEPCFASIMSSEPDLGAVTEWAERFAHALEVDPASVEVDPRTGRVKGRFEALAGLGTATFAIEGSRFEVSAWPPVEGADAVQLPLRSMSWRFENDGGTPGKAALFLQNHPDTAGSVHDFVGERTERIVGWGFAAGERGAIASPTVVRVTSDEPGAWIIGRPQSTPDSDWPGYFIDGSHRVLLGKLAPYAKR